MVLCLFIDSNSQYSSFLPVHGHAMVLTDSVINWILENIMSLLLCLACICTSAAGTSVNMEPNGSSDIHSRSPYSPISVLRIQRAVSVEIQKKESYVLSKLYHQQEYLLSLEPSWSGFIMFVNSEPWLCLGQLSHPLATPADDLIYTYFL